MNISSAVIQDLYPLYEAGEVSPDSRALIEEYMAEHPGALASHAPIRLPAVEPPQDLEVRALKRTAKLLEDRNLTGVAALILSFAPAAVGFIEQGKLHLLYQDSPWLAGVCYAAAIFLWVRFFRACVRVQAAGFTPRRTWTARFVWLFAGIIVGSAVSVPVQYWTGWQRVLYDLPWILGLAAIGIGERLGQIASSGEITRPISLFGEKDDDGEA